MEPTVEHRVKAIIAKQLGVKEDDIVSDKSLADDLGADSLDAVEVIMAIEEEFEIEIPEDRAEGLKTVGEVVTYISSNLS